MIMFGIILSVIGAWQDPVVGMILTALVTWWLARPKTKAEVKSTNVSTDIKQSQEQRDAATFHEKEWEKLTARYDKLEEEYQKAIKTNQELIVSLAEMRRERDELKRERTLLKTQKNVL